MALCDDVVASMCTRYAEAVNASDSELYATLFESDAIRVPPGATPEYGPDEIRAGEQSDYDVATWQISPSPRDALQVADDWVYGLADIDVTTTEHDGGAQSAFTVTVSWLLHRAGDEWLIHRQMWNRRP